MTTTAKVFKNGRSQAVRLPKEFRFSVDEVRVTRHGKGILLEPVEDQSLDIDDWFRRLDAIAGADFTNFIEVPEDMPVLPEAIFDI